MPYYSKFSDNPLRTRADFQQAARDLFEPMVPYLERQGARIDFDEGGAHYDMRSSSVEGVARPLWGIVPLTAGGGEFAHWPLLRGAIAEGTDPDHPRFWGVAGDFCQRSVEMAALGIMLLFTPEQGWDPLSDREKHNLVTWLERIQHVKLVQNNWLFFAVLVQEGLRRIGLGHLVDEGLQKDHLQKLSNWYLGDGWYGDGAGASHRPLWRIRHALLLAALRPVRPEEGSRPGSHVPEAVDGVLGTVLLLVRRYRRNPDTGAFADLPVRDGGVLGHGRRRRTRRTASRAGQGDLGPADPFVAE